MGGPWQDFGSRLRFFFLLSGVLVALRGEKWVPCRGAGLGEGSEGRGLGRLLGGWCGGGLDGWPAGILEDAWLQVLS